RPSTPGTGLRPPACRTAGGTPRGPASPTRTSRTPAPATSALSPPRRAGPRSAIPAPPRRRPRPGRAGQSGRRLAVESGTPDRRPRRASGRRCRTRSFGELGGLLGVTLAVDLGDHLLRVFPVRFGERATGRLARGRDVDPDHFPTGHPCGDLGTQGDHGVRRRVA